VLAPFYLFFLEVSGDDVDSAGFADPTLCCLPGFLPLLALVHCLVHSPWLIARANATLPIEMQAAKESAIRERECDEQMGEKQRY